MEVKSILNLKIHMILVQKNSNEHIKGKKKPNFHIIKLFCGNLFPQIVFVSIYLLIMLDRHQPEHDLFINCVSCVKPHNPFKLNKDSRFDHKQFALKCHAFYFYS